jgi:hypothetical protein
VAANAGEPIDLSDARLEELRAQVEAQLRPVLRSADYDNFDLDRVVMILNEVVSFHEGS